MFRTPRASLTLIAFATVVSIPTVPALAGEEASRDWTVTLDADAVWGRATPAGVLVLGTRAGIVGLDGESGKILWRIDDLIRADGISLDVLPRNPYALLRLKNGIRGKVVRVLIDVTTGREVWDSSALGLTDVSRELFVPALDALLVAGKADDRKVVVVVDLASGRRLREIAVPEKQAGSILSEPILFDTDSTLVTVSGDRLVRYDLQSGGMIWASPKLAAGTGKGCGFPPEIPAAQSPGFPLGAATSKPLERSDPRPLLPTAPLLFSSDGQRLFVARGLTLHALDAHGLPSWRDPPELCGRCVQVLESGDGVLARTMSENVGNDKLVVLETGSGAVRWEYPEALKSMKSIFKAGFKAAFKPVALSNPVMDSKAAYVLDRRKLMRIDLATGEASKIGETRIDEEDAHLRLERDGEGFLVVGQQEIEWLDTGGQSVRRVHYDPPGDIGKAIALLGVAAAMNEIGTQSFESRHYHDGHVDRTVGKVTFNPRGLYGPITQSFLREYHASSTMDSLIFMLADLDEAGFKGPTLVAIDKRSGETVHRVPASKNPNYNIDPVRGWIFVLDFKKIHGHGL